MWRAMRCCGAILSLCLLLAFPKLPTTSGVSFSLPVRTGATTGAVQWLHFDSTKQTAADAAHAFCTEQGIATTTNCVAVLAAAVEKRGKWATNEKRFQIVDHSEIGVLDRIDFAHELRRFDSREASEEIQQGMAHLREHGYVVFSHVASADDLAFGMDKFWDYFAKFGVNRSDIATWGRIPSNEFGIILQFGIGQSEAMWHVRGLPRVRRIFEAVWGVQDLIVDFGGAVVFRPSNCTDSWRTAEGWFHVDQNAATRPGLQTVQGSLAFTDHTPETGGLVVVPNSWRDHDRLSVRAGAFWGSDPHNQFLLVPPNDPVLTEYGSPVFIPARRGDLVLWDSRSVHCNTVGRPALTRTKGSDADTVGVDVQVDGNSAQRVMQKMRELRPQHAGVPRFENLSCHELKNDPNPMLQRLVALVSMAPRSMATPEVLQQRRNALALGQTTTHWPFLFVADDPRYPPAEVSLTEEQLKLV